MVNLSVPRDGFFSCHMFELKHCKENQSRVRKKADYLVQRNEPRDAFKIVSRFTGKKRIIMNVLRT